MNLFELPLQAMELKQSYILWKNSELKQLSMFLFIQVWQISVWIITSQEWTNVVLPRHYLLTWNILDRLCKLIPSVGVTTEILHTQIINEKIFWSHYNKLSQSTTNSIYHIFITKLQQIFWNGLFVPSNIWNTNCSWL